MFLFQRCWVFFRIFNLVGVFPCYRETIEGQKHLRANTGICQLLKYLIFASLCFVAPVMVGYKNGVTIAELYQFFAKTPTDLVAFTGIWICFFFEHTLSLVFLFCIRNNFCMLQDFILEKFPFDLPPENVYYKMAVFLWIPFSSLTAILFLLGFYESGNFALPTLMGLKCKIVLMFHQELWSKAFKVSLRVRQRV